MMAIDPFPQAFRHYFRSSSNTQIILVFAGVGAVAALLTYMYVYFIGRHSDRLLLRYFMSVLFFAGGIVFFIIARNAKDGFAGLAYAIFAFFLLYSMVVSLVVTIILFAFFL